MKNRNMIDLGFANGWHENSIENRLVSIVREAGYQFKQVEHDVRGYDTVYECQEAGLRYHVCSD